MIIDLERDKKVFGLLKQIYELTDAGKLIVESGCEAWYYNPITNIGSYVYRPNDWTEPVEYDIQL